MSEPLPSAPPADGPRARSYLMPGQIRAASEPTEITTILGSCVAVCLWDAERGTGGMTHFVLPEELGAAEAGNFKFGSAAVPGLIAALAGLGARTSALQAKVFGGANMVRTSAAKQIGDRNVELALRLLGEHHIPVVAQDLGESRGRKLIFHSDTGAAWVKRIGE